MFCRHVHIFSCTVQTYTVAYSHLIHVAFISCHNEWYGRHFIPSNGPLASMSDYKNKWDESFGSDRFL